MNAKNKRIGKLTKSAQVLALKLACNKGDCYKDIKKPEEQILAIFSMDPTKFREEVEQNIGKINVNDFDKERLNEQRRKLVIVLRFDLNQVISRYTGLINNSLLLSEYKDFTERFLNYLINGNVHSQEYWDAVLDLTSENLKFGQKTIG